jgi:hypothetical protein
MMMMMMMMMSKTAKTTSCVPVLIKQEILSITSLHPCHRNITTSRIIPDKGQTTQAHRGTELLDIRSRCLPCLRPEAGMNGSKCPRMQGKVAPMGYRVFTHSLHWTRGKRKWERNRLLYATQGLAVRRVLISLLSLLRFYSPFKPG